MSEPQHVSTYVQEALAIGDGNLCQVQHEFIEEVFELCFGEGGINRFSMAEALKKIREFSDKALAFEEGYASAVFDGTAKDAQEKIAKGHMSHRDLSKIQPTFTVGEDGEPMI